MNNFSLFVKPWMNLSIPEMISKLKELEVSNIEFPIRVGYDITPDNCVEKLPILVEEFKKEGINVTSIAGNVDERIFKAMNLSGIELMRVMLWYDPTTDYRDAEDNFVKMLDEAAEYCEKYNTKVGIQPHAGPYVATVMELKHLLDRCNRKYIGAIWDTGHAGIAAEIPKKSIDLIYDYLFMVNLKSANFRKIIKEDGSIFYHQYFVPASESPCSWEESISYLKEKGYDGMYCSHAEYSFPDEPLRYADGAESEPFFKEDYELFKKLIK